MTAAVRYESLEMRRLLSATLSSAGVLTVTGTSGADVVGIAVVGTTVRVGINSQGWKFQAANVKSISVDLGDGNDRFDVGAGVGRVYVLGGQGNDTINGGAANDTITAGGGKDVVDGGAGDDRLNGGPTADYLVGGVGNDRLYGSDANDVLDGGAGVDRLWGGDGSDYMSGGSSNDKLYGEAGNDTLNGDKQNDLLSGGDGDDIAFGGLGLDTLAGGNGNDNLSGQDDDDTETGDAGANTLDGGAGNDSLHGGLQNDTITGGDGNDTLDGSVGDDSLSGDAGDDSIIGYDGADSLDGGIGHDTLSGGAGNDALFGSADSDPLIGGPGADRFLARKSEKVVDLTSQDAVVAFKDGTTPWSNAQVRLVDKGLSFLVQRTNSTKMLKLAGGGLITFIRVGTLGTDVLGENPGDGTIEIDDLAFDPTSNPTADVTTVHEIGHNWDSDDENSTARTFFELSHWRDRNGVWTYDPTAQFARDYGRTNPQEDFATALEVYYDKSNPAKNWQAKWDYMDGFLNSMSA